MNDSISILATVQKPTLDQVFQSVQGSINEPADFTRLIAFGIFLLACGLAFWAVRSWMRRQTQPRQLNSAPKLAAAICKQTGISRDLLRRLEPLAEQQGVSDPLVVLICPSLLKTMAKTAKTKAEKQAVLEAVKLLSAK